MTDHEWLVLAKPLELETVSAKVCEPTASPEYVRGDAHGALTPSRLHVVVVTAVDVVHENDALVDVVEDAGTDVSFTVKGAGCFGRADAADGSAMPAVNDTTATSVARPMKVAHLDRRSFRGTSRRRTLLCRFMTLPCGWDRDEWCGVGRGGGGGDAAALGLSPSGLDHSRQP